MIVSMESWIIEWALLPVAQAFARDGMDLYTNCCGYGGQQRLVHRPGSADS